MTEWNEETFLERLMPSMQQQRRAARSGCPDIEVLCALSDDRIIGQLKSDITAHVAACPRCSELYSRLTNFATPGVREDEQEWTNAEKRLENWTEGFLRSAQPSRSTSHGGPQLAPSGERVRWWTPWKIGVSLGAVATALAAITIAVLLLPKSANRPVETAKTTSAPATAPPMNAPAASTAARPTSLPSAMPQPTQVAPASTAPSQSRESALQPSTAVTATPNAEAPKSINQKSVEPAANVGSDAAKEPVVVAESQAASPNEASGYASGVRRGFPMHAPAPSYHAVPQQSASARAASAPGPQPSALPSPQPLAPPPVATATEKPADLRSLSHSTTASEPMLRAPLPSLPASFRLEAGTRLWIRLISLTRQTDGSIRFEGTLLEPVNEAGTLRLEHGTAISGFEVQKQNAISLVIVRFSVDTVPYTLKGETGTAASLSSSTGKALQFDQGQVLETFIGAPAVYERASGNPQQPQR